MDHVWVNSDFRVYPNSEIFRMLGVMYVIFKERKNNVNIVKFS